MVLSVFVYNQFTFYPVILHFSSLYAIISIYSADERNYIS